MDRDREKPRLSGEGARRADARQERLAKALRQNLARRKTQQRARAADTAAPSEAEPGTAADEDAAG